MRAELKATVEKETLHTDTSKLLRSEKCKAGYLGVTADGSRFQARLMLNGKQTHLGTYKTAEEAAAAVTIKYNEQHNIDAIGAPAHIQEHATKQAQLKVDAAMRAEPKASVQKEGLNSQSSKLLPLLNSKPGYHVVSAIENEFQTAVTNKGMHSGTYENAEEAAAAVTMKHTELHNMDRSSADVDADAEQALYSVQRGSVPHSEKRVDCTEGLTVNLHSAEGRDTIVMEVQNPVDSHECPLDCPCATDPAGAPRKEWRLKALASMPQQERQLLLTTLSPSAQAVMLATMHVVDPSLKFILTEPKRNADAAVVRGLQDNIHSQHDFSTAQYMRLVSVQGLTGASTREEPTMQPNSRHDQQGLVRTPAGRQVGQAIQTPTRILDELQQHETPIVGNGADSFHDAESFFQARVSWRKFLGGHLGVSVAATGFTAHLKFDSRTENLGTYTSVEEAAAVVAIKHTELQELAQLKKDAAMRAELRATVEKGALHTDASKLLRSENSKTGYLGVTADGARFQAQMTLNGKGTSLGSYKTAEGAAAAVAIKHNEKQAQLKVDAAIRAELKATVEKETMHTDTSKLLCSENSKAGYLGVTADSARFQARLMLNGKQMQLGYYKTAEEAAAAAVTIKHTEVHNVDPETASEHTEEHLEKQAQMEESETMRAELRATVEKEALHTDGSKLLRSEKSKTGYFGVVANGNSFQATLQLNGKSTNLRRYETAEGAAAAVAIKHSELHNVDPASAAAHTEQHVEKQAQLKESETMRAELRATMEEEALHTDTSKLLRSENSKTGYFGVTANGSGFRASLMHSGKQMHLGSYKTVEEAAAAVTIKHTELQHVARLRATVEKEAMHIDASKLLRSENSKTGYFGVVADGSRFKARLMLNGKQLHLGRYKTAEDAAAAVTIKHNEKHNMDPVSAANHTEEHAEKQSQMKESKTMRAELRANVEKEALHPEASKLLRSEKTNTGYFGVTTRGSSFQASLMHSGKKMHLGSYKTAEGAAAAVAIKHSELHNVDPASAAAHTEQHVEKQAQLKESETMRAELRPTVEKEALHTDGSKLLRSENSKTGYFGVTAHNRRFKASLMHSGKQIHLGNCETAEEAAGAVTIKHTELHNKERHGNTAPRHNKLLRDLQPAAQHSEGSKRRYLTQLRYCLPPQFEWRGCHQVPRSWFCPPSLCIQTTNNRIRQQFAEDSGRRKDNSK